MTSSYPGNLDNLATNKADGTSTATDHAVHHNDLADAINKIETELGTHPSGDWNTVAARLLAAEAPQLALAEFYGHSLTVSGPPDTYVEDLCNALGVRRRNHRGWGGSISCWPTSNQINATGDGGWGWVLREAIRPGSPAFAAGVLSKEGHPESAAAPYVPRTNLALHHQALNDLATLGSQKPRPMLEAHRTIWSRLCAAAVWEETSSRWTFNPQVGRVGAVGGLTWSGGAVDGVSAVNDAATFTIPSDYPAGHVIALGLWVNHDYNFTIGVRVNGVDQPDAVVVGTQLTDSALSKSNLITLRFGRATSGSQLSPFDYPVNLAAGQTIELRVKSKPGPGAVIVDYAQIEANPLDGPLLVVPRPNRCITYSLWNTWNHGPLAGSDPMNDAAIASWDTSLQALASEFPGRVVMADIDSALNKDSTYFGPDGAHMNVHGTSLVARTVREAIMESDLLTPRIATAPVSDLGTYFTPVGHGPGPAFANSWNNDASTVYPLLGFTRDLEGQVRIRGAVTKTTGAATDTITTLPGSGYLPAHRIDRPITVWNGAAFGVGVLRISNTGAVNIVSGGSIAAGNINIIDATYQAAR